MWRNGSRQERIQGEGKENKTDSGSKQKKKKGRLPHAVLTRAPILSDTGPGG